MIAALIAILILVILMAIFIGKNLGNSCSIWFFKDFGQTNIVIIVFIAFAAGIIISLLLFLIGKGLKTARKRQENPKNSSKDLKSIKKMKNRKFKSENKNDENLPSEGLSGDDAKKSVADSKIKAEIKTDSSENKGR